MAAALEALEARACMPENHLDTDRGHGVCSWRDSHAMHQQLNSGASLEGPESPSSSQLQENRPIFGSLQNAAFPTSRNPLALTTRPAKAAVCLVLGETFSGL